MNKTVLEDHVLSLCERHDIRLFWCSRARYAVAIVTNVIVPRIFVPPIRSISSYAVAMHEIGHVVGRHGQSKNKLVRERWAWKWAKDNALVWSELADRFAKEAFESHGHALVMRQLGWKPSRTRSGHRRSRK